MAKKAANNHDPLALIAHSNASLSHPHVNSSYSPQSYYLTHPSSVVDYDDEYQRELQCQSIQTIHVLGKKPNKVYDPFLKARLCYTNPEHLKKAIVAQPKMYDGDSLHSNKKSNAKRALFTSPVVAESKDLGATFVVAKSRFSMLKVYDCNLQLLRNFVEKFMGTVHFGNDHFAAITDYGDYVQGNLTICHVYYVEALGHNLFSIGQFCDRDLEVAFRSNTCYVQNLEGYDLLTSSRDSNLYIISIFDMAASSPVCLMSRATLSKS
nr:retrovirus-related Pol polyprotein from transposon TNT 1-94 [Tanacetum cinerariifolium]